MLPLPCSKLMKVDSAGIVKSAKMDKTIIVRRNYAHYVKKYSR